MKHDKSKLGEIIDNRSREDDRFTLVLDDTEAELAAQEYAEHMARWRPVSEQPETAQTIITSHDVELWAIVVDFDPETEPDDLYMANATHWRPIELPEAAG